MHKKLLLFASLVVALGAIGVWMNRSHAQSAPAARTVSTADLVSAGFHNVTVQPQKGTTFAPPNLYFRTAETVMATHPEWGDAANLVAVLITPISDPFGTATSTPRQVKDLYGRTQVDAFIPGFYISVTGPDHDKVVALEQLLEKK